jgi:hypothetical protein
VLSAFLAALTVVWRDWIEGLFGFSPDRGNGSFEWEFVAVCFAAAILCSVVARREWRSVPRTPAFARARDGTVVR